MNRLAYILGWFLGTAIKAATWLLEDTGTGRGEVAEHPDVPEGQPELPPCGMRLHLSDEHIAASIAELEKQFPRPRRIR